MGIVSLQKAAKKHTKLEVFTSERNSFKFSFKSVDDAKLITKACLDNMVAISNRVKALHVWSFEKVFYIMAESEPGVLVLEQVSESFYL